MPLGGIFLCLFVGWVWGFERMKEALTNGGELELAILAAVLHHSLRVAAADPDRHAQGAGAVLMACCRKNAKERRWRSFMGSSGWHPASYQTEAG